MAALGKVLAVCGATAAGSAACVATGVVEPGSVGIGGDQERTVNEQPDRPVEAPIDQQVVSPAPPSEAQSPAADELKPSEQANKDFGFESSAATGASGGGEFGGPSGGGSSSGGGSADASGGIGFEK